MNDEAKETIDTLWGLNQYKTGKDASMLSTDQKISLKEMKKKQCLPVNKKGKITL